MTKTAAVTIVALLVAGCGGPNQPSVSALTSEFVYQSLAFAPVAATGAGYHRHGDIDLDVLLDDPSPGALDRQLAFYRGFLERIQRLDSTRLSLDEAADVEILRGQAELALLELDEIRSHEHNPTLYVELVGNGLFQPWTLHYASKPERFAHIIARLRRVPDLAARAKAHLRAAPSIWTEVAEAENDGNLALIDQELRADVPPELAARYNAAAAAALTALEDLQTFLRTELSRRSGADWRLGETLYARKFRLALGTDRTPDDVLQEAEQDLVAVRERMAAIARELGARDVPEALARVARRQATPETYLAQVRADLDEARTFVHSSGLLRLPPRDNLEVIDTPEFMRGIYAVGGFSPAPPLEPHLGAFYWLTPIPRDWPRDRIESKLREYNFYKLKLLTIHEAMPGHYVQFEYANDVQPSERRLLRALYGNGPYIEGWGQYATEAMLDAGYLNHSPELRLTFLKEELRVIANAILDIRLHTKNMTDEEALHLMMEDTYQEREEAVAKLRRAKLSSCQLPTYLVGWRGWRRVRDEVRAERGDAWNAAEFHEAALSQGAVPLPALRRLLMRQ
ncbi:MAG: DUF885 domain-containing protein [Bryobacterales bacterium]|nr:DUF885 domain-containing protein [Bryobacterales bacterium]